jgi:hypothetical protein
MTLLVYCFLLYAGSYELLPYYKGENTVFDISPSSLPVSVEHSHLTIPQKFQVLPEIDSHLIVSGIEVSVKVFCLRMMKNKYLFSFEEKIIWI